MGKFFEEAYPERHFEMGIAEANMTSVAAGLAQTGKIPYTNSFAVFAGGRAFDQIRQTIAIGKLNVKICGSSSGLSDFGDGATHQCVEDMAIFRSGHRTWSGGPYAPDFSSAGNAALAA